MEELQQQQNRLAAHRNRLAVLLEQQATLGVVYTPPAVVTDIDAARAEIRRIKVYLRGRGVAVEDLPDDDPPPHRRVTAPQPRGFSVERVRVAVIVIAAAALVFFSTPLKSLLTTGVPALATAVPSSASVPTSVPPREVPTGVPVLTQTLQLSGEPLSSASPYPVAPSATLAPTTAGDYNDRGWGYLNQNQLDKALADFTQAIALDPTYAKPYYGLGWLYYHQNQVEKSLANFTQAIILDPKYAIAYNDRGWVYRDQGQLDKALNDFTQSITLDPKGAAAYYTRGLVYRDQGQLDKALSDFTQAITLDPKGAAAYYTRGQIYQQRNDRDAAISDFRKARDLYTTPSDKQNVTDQLKALGAE